MEVNKNKLMTNNPLVSVVVITYNSASFISETLDSIYHQTYQNIELVISDDCSGDETLNHCEKWISSNKKRFFNVALIKSSRNTGIASNVNRGWKAATGTWVKFLAGDDILDKYCIESNIDFISNDSKVELLVSKFSGFRLTDHGEKLSLKTHPAERSLKFFELSTQRQYKYFLTDSFNISPTEFIKKETLVKLNGFNEKFPFLEDLPFYLKATKSGIKIYFLNKITLYYRMHENSIRVDGNKTLYSIKFMDSLFAFKKEMVYPNVPFYYIFFWQSEWVRFLSYRIIVKYFDNRKDRVTSLVHRVLTLLDLRSSIRKLLN